MSTSRASAGPGRGVKALMAMLDGAAAPRRPSPRRSCATATSSSRMSRISSPISARSSASRRRTRRSRVFAHGLQLTITDFVAEVHDTHHPISTDLYYEDQKSEAKARAAAFLAASRPEISRLFRARPERQPGRPGACGRRRRSPLSTCRSSRSGRAWPTPSRAPSPAPTSATRRWPRSPRRRGAPQHRPLSRLGPAHPVQRVRRLPALSGARPGPGDGGAPWVVIPFMNFWVIENIS